jgi:hypothetical protein
MKQNPRDSVFSKATVCEIAEGAHLARAWWTAEGTALKVRALDRTVSFSVTPAAHKAKKMAEPHELRPTQYL